MSGFSSSFRSGYGGGGEGEGEGFSGVQYTPTLGSENLVVRGGGGAATYNGITNIAGRTRSNLARERADFSRIHTRNQPFDALAVIGDHVEPTPMMRAFFSKENMRIIQNGICAEVYRLSGPDRYIIPYQNASLVSERMRDEFLAGLPYDPRTAREDIRRLNSYVVEGEAKCILRNIAFQQHYKEQVSRMPVNEFEPENTSRRRRTYDATRQVLIAAPPAPSTTRPSRLATMIRPTAADDLG